MNSRQHVQPFNNNSLAIREEIRRFESVHPSIYAIYDLIELIPDPIVSQQIRDHVVCIEGMLNVCENVLLQRVAKYKILLKFSVTSYISLSVESSSSMLQW